LNIADGTIKLHLHYIYQKLEISTRTVLAALAILHNDNREDSRIARNLATRVTDGMHNH